MARDASYGRLNDDSQAMLHGDESRTQGQMPDRLQLQIAHLRGRNDLGQQAMNTQLDMLNKMQAEMEAKYRQSQLDHEVLLQESSLMI